MFDNKTTVFKAKANMFDSEKIIFEAKRTHYTERKLFSKRSEHISLKDNYPGLVAAGRPLAGPSQQELSWKEV